MLKIRLSRGGAKKRPFYHIVVAEVTAPRDGRFIEKLGFYNPMVPKDDAGRLKLDKDRIDYWLSVGAKPTDRICRFLAAHSIGNVKRDLPRQTKKADPSEKTQQRRADKKAKQETARAAQAAAVEEHIPLEEPVSVEEPAASVPPESGGTAES